MPKKFSHYTQADAKDCGATCLKIIVNYYYKTETLTKRAFETP